MFILLFVSEVSAESGDIYASGSGARDSCGQWIAAKDNDNSRRYRYAEWINGFLTGYNYYSPKQQALVPDNAAMLAFVDNYCSKNPLQTLILAAAALVQEAGGKPAIHQWK